MIIIKKYKLVMQDEYKDCGVSCISTILSYYGGYVKKSKLLDITKTNKKGTTAYNIKETLNELGFDAKGIKCSLKDLNEDNILLPCIASVIVSNSYKHFVVIYEINFKKKYLIIGDPADKVKKISFDAFNVIFNNVLIICHPIKNMIVEKNSSFFDFLYPLIVPYKKELFKIFILSIFITLFSIIVSFYTQYMINSLIYYSKYYLLLLFCIFFSIHILKIISNYFRNKLLLFINQKLDLALTLNVFNKIIDLPYNYYQNRTTGDVISRVNDLESVRDMVGKVAISIFVDLPLTFISLIVLYIINKSLLIIGILMLFLYIFLILIFKKVFNNYISKIKVKRSETTSYMIESISGYETIKGVNIEDDVKNKFEKKYVKFLKDIFSYQNLYFLQNSFKELIDNIGTILIFFVGCVYVIEGKMTIGSLLTFSSITIYFLEPIKNVINLDTIVKEAKISLRRIIDVVTYDTTNSGFLDKYEKGDIEFKNLSYSFNDREYVLKNINLKVKENDKVMVVGKSGSGKSTLFKALAGLYNVKDGSILIGHNDMIHYKKSTIKSNIFYLGQNEILFNDTLYNNLIFDNSDKSKLLDISKMCFVDKILDSNLGYNMLIEENGYNLSGGERQRIILARTLLKNFNVLIIDEGLSEVDVDMERIILKNIFEYFNDKTIIFISHRLDNLDLFDSKITFKNGAVYYDRRNG